MSEAAWNGRSLPVAAEGRNSVGWWGMLCLIATESSLFAYLLFSYYYTAAQRGPAWLPNAHPSSALANRSSLTVGGPGAPAPVR